LNLLSTSSSESKQYLEGSPAAKQHETLVNSIRAGSGNPATDSYRMIDRRAAYRFSDGDLRFKADTVDELSPVSFSCFNYIQVDLKQ
jgi:hypothetical protein